MNNPYRNRQSGLSAFLSDKDVLTRHKWPEEKPDRAGKYLVKLNAGRYSYYELARWHLGGWKSVDSNYALRDISEFVTRWWELPGGDV